MRQQAFGAASESSRYRAGNSADRREKTGPCPIRVEVQNRGSDRHSKDDRIVRLPNGGVIIDGMSQEGKGSGGIAADITKDILEFRLGRISRTIDPVEALKRIIPALQEADMAVATTKIVLKDGRVIIPQTEDDQSAKQLDKMGATATVGLIFHHNGKEHLVVAWAGDTPGYLIRRGQPVETIASEIDLKGGIIHGKNSRLENCVGVARYGRNFKVSTDIIELQPGDKVVLASDGVASEQLLSPEQIGQIVESTPGNAAHRLVEEAWAKGSDGYRDDASAMVIRPDILPAGDSAHLRERRGSELRRRLDRRRFTGLVLGVLGAGILGYAGLSALSSNKDKRSAPAPKPAGSPGPVPSVLVPKDYPKPVIPENGEKPKEFPEPGRPAVKPPEATPTPQAPKPEAKPGGPDRAKVNFENDNSINFAVREDIVNTIGSLLKEPYQGSVTKDSQSSDPVVKAKLEQDLRASGKRIVDDPDPVKREALKKKPTYKIDNLRQLLPVLGNSIVPPEMKIHHQANTDFKEPVAISFTGQLPLGQIPEIAGRTVSAELPDGSRRKFDEIPATEDRVEIFRTATNSVFDLGLLDKNHFQDGMATNDVYRISSPRPNGDNFEMIVSRSGRFMIRMYSGKYDGSGLENLELPPYPKPDLRPQASPGPLF